jgi:hypothetical protein
MNDHNLVVTRDEAREEFDRIWMEDPRTQLRHEELQEVLGADLDRVGEMPIDTARELVKQIVYLLMHMVYDEEGRLATGVEARKIVRTYYPELLEAAHMSLSLGTVEKYRQEMADRVWTEKYPDMMKLTQDKFRQTMQQIEMIMPQIMAAIARGDLKAVPDFAMMKKLEEGLLGYGAAQKVSVYLGEEEAGMTDQDMLKAAAASEAVADYDTQLLMEKIGDVAGGAIEGELSGRDELQEAMLASAEAAKVGLDEFVEEIAAGIDEQIREQTGVEPEEASESRHL